MSSTPETSREPCPDRILDDLGGAFGMGAVGGSAFHFLKGLYNSPKGHRLSGATTAVRLNAPRLGGSFAVWGGLFSSFDCTMVYLRQKEDPWNSIIAGAATGGFLAMRRGLRPAATSALFGGILLAGIEGAGIMLNQMMSPNAAAPPPVEDVAFRQEAPEGNSWFGVFGGNKEANVQSYRGEAAAAEGGSSWFGWFGGGGKEGEKKSEVLESFDGVQNLELKRGG